MARIYVGRPSGSLHEITTLIAVTLRTSSIPLVIDTDTAQDDCVAILVGLLDPAADLRAITMVAGNVGFDHQVHNAWMTLNVAERLDVPIHLGCRRPLVREWASAEDVHGDGGGGLAIDEAGLVPHPEHAVDALIRMAADAPGELTIVCIGPLTNLAMAAIKDPDFVGNVKALYVMGGSNNARGNITAAAEYNFYVDPDAAKVVFAAGFDITVIPWAPLVLEGGLLSRDEFARIAALGTPLARFFSRVCEATLEYLDSVGIEGSTHPDSLTTAVLLRPELVLQSARYAVDIEADSELTRGYSAMSWGVHGLDPNATVIERVDRSAFVDYLRELLAIPTDPPRAFSPPL